jgi:hypothetical protein
MIKTESRLLNQKNLLVIFVLSFSIAFWVFFRKSRQEWVDAIYKPKEIHVRVLGNVINPGVYTVSEGSTYLEVLKRASLPDQSEIYENFPLDLEVSDGQVLQVNR